MLGLECPRCSRPNPVGERPRCVYCGHPLGAGESESSGAQGPDPVWTDPNDVEITLGDRAGQLLRSWPGAILAFVLLFLGGLWFYKSVLEHYAPHLAGNPERAERRARRADEAARHDAEAALDRIDVLLGAHADDHGGYPEALSPSLEELAPYGDVEGPLGSLAGNSIESYRLDRQEGREIYFLQARARDEERTLKAIKGTYYHD